MAFMHNAPRFWHTRNIATLASQTASVKQNYIQGIVAFSVFLCSLFLFWCIFILYFKVRGYKRYGCMAGQVTSTEEVVETKSYKRYKTIRYVFFVAICGIFIGSTLLLNKGVPFLAEAVTEIKVLNEDLRNTLYEGKTVASYMNEGIQGVQDPLSALSSYIDMNDFCPNQSGNDTFKIDSSISDIVNRMSGVKDFLQRSEIVGLESNLDIMIERSSSLDEALDAYTRNDWLVKMYSLIVGILSFYFVAYALIGWCNLGNPAAKAMVSYFVLPLFFAMIAIGWIITIVFAVGSVLNSDFCVGDGINGPEATIEEALLQYGITEDHLMFQSFLYYKSQCTIEKSWDSEVIMQIASIRSSIDATSNILTNEDNIKNSCGDSVDGFLETIDDLKRNLQVLALGFEGGLNISRCSKVLPMYRRVFNGASCQESLTGLSWMFYALFSVTMSGIVIISFRSALFKVKTISNAEMRRDDIYNDEDLAEDDLEDSHQSVESSSRASGSCQIKTNADVAMKDGTMDYIDDDVLQKLVNEETVPFECCVQGFSRSTHGCNRRGLESEGFDILYVGDVNGFESSSRASDGNYQIKTMSDTEMRDDMDNNDDDLEACTTKSIESSYQ